MRTLSTQVRLRRLIRAASETIDRHLTEPLERSERLGAVFRLHELATQVREAWSREMTSGRLDGALDRYVDHALRTAELAIAGLAQDGADLRLLQRDFEDAALPLEVFLRGLDTPPALERSA